MISSLSYSAQNFLYGINRIQKRLQTAQTELTTGLRVSTVADDPSAIASLVQTRSDLNRANQTIQNLNIVKAEVDTGESAVSSAVSAVEHALTLGSQGQSGFTSAQTRADVAGELGSVLQQLVGIANTSVSGRYIFSGDSDQTAPYSIDLTQSNPISAYQGTPSTRQVSDIDGSLFPVAKTAQELFDSPDPSSNVFQAINNVRNALLNNDQKAIDAALPDLQKIGSYLNQQLSTYGAAQNRVNNGIANGATLTTQIQTRLSGIEDADATQSILEFNQDNTQLQAALESRAKLPSGSLFNYLS